MAVSAAAALTATTAVSTAVNSQLLFLDLSVCLQYSSLCLASLLSLCSAVSQSASCSLRLVSLSSLCSAAFSACLSLHLVTVVSLVCCFICLPFSSPRRHCSLSTLCSAVSCLSLHLVSLSVLPFISLVSSFPSPCSCRSRSAHYMSIARTRSGSDVVVVVVHP